MKIVAFLQNMWLHNPARARAMIARDATGLLRERIIAYALFAGCLTGRRLRAALGRDLCDRIIWEEASPAILDNPRECPPADPQHIRAIIEKHAPELVICFSVRYGAIVKDVARSLSVQNVFIFPHPAARGSFVPKALAIAKACIESLNPQP